MDRLDNGEASFSVCTAPGRGLGDAYHGVMAKWSDAIDVCPDHVEQVVAYAFEWLEVET